MHLIIFNPEIHSYNPQTKTFSMSEKGMPFSTTYEIKNTETGKTKKFEFSHSTGPEFDPNTKWIYKCDDLTLEVCNDAKITAILAQNYLNAKLRK